MDEQQMSHVCCYKILQMVGVLHSRGYQRLRVFPCAREMWWQCEIAPGALFDPENGACVALEPLHYRAEIVAKVSNSDGTHPFGWRKSIASMTPTNIANLFLERFPALTRESHGSDWGYAGWYQEMLLRTSPNVLPIAFFCDGYEISTSNPLKLYRIDEAVNGLMGGSMPLPPAYPHTEPMSSLLQDLKPQKLWRDIYR